MVYVSARNTLSTLTENFDDRCQEVLDTASLIPGDRVTMVTTSSDEVLGGFSSQATVNEIE